MMEDDGSKENLQLKPIFTTPTKHGVALGKGASSAGSQDKCSKGREQKTWDIQISRYPKGLPTGNLT